MKTLLKHKDLLSVVIILLSAVLFFYPFLFFGKLPIPSDTITGLYHPFRDFYAKDYPNGMPYKNYIVTDPVRQQFVWKELAVEALRNKQIPIWNMYEMSGKPLLANFQSGVFYPINLVLFINPFSFSWSIFIFLQMILGGIFMFLYLRSLNLSLSAVVLGSVSWIFSGFFIAWLEWGTIAHTALWLPLILVSIKSILDAREKRLEMCWFFVLLISLCFAFLAGHLQTFFYISIFSFAYMLALWFISGRKLIKLVPFLTVFILFITITSIQWVPTLQLIDLSGRSEDQIANVAGWFIPISNLAQFVAPDYLGNPSTLNYYGIFNYGEFVGYIGVGGLLFALLAVFYRHDRKVLFYAVIFVLSILFAIQNPISQLPFQLKIPFISTSQPTRLLVLSCFSLSVLAALGFDYFLKKKKILFPILTVGVMIFVLWAGVLFFPSLYPAAQDVLVSKNNLKLPTILFIVFSLLGVLYVKMGKKFLHVFIILVLLLTVFDVLRFGWKYTPFTSSDYLFPNTKIIQFLKDDKSIFRVSTTDDRILPPNFSTAYRIESIEGYDPLFLKNYGTFIVSSQRPDHLVKEPFGFNRTIRPRNLGDNVVDFLNIKYILTFDELNNPAYEKVLEEGMTKLYRNKNVLPRSFFVKKVVSADTNQRQADIIHDSDLSSTAVVSDKELAGDYSIGVAEIKKYDSSEIMIKTENQKDGFLVVSEVFYPSFRATIDGNDAHIVPVNIAFRGIKVPSGTHTIIIKPSLF